MPNDFFYVVFYIMNHNIYNLFYICMLAYNFLWALFLRINLFVFVKVPHLNV